MVVAGGREVPEGSESTFDNFGSSGCGRLVNSPLLKRLTLQFLTFKDLSRRPSFINPFLVACNTRNARLAAIAVVCLQRLVVSRALPKERLKEVLEAFRECSSQGSESDLAESVLY